MMTQSVLSVVLLLASASAFSSRPVAFTDTRCSRPRSPAFAPLHASRNKLKIASRSKWAAERGYGTEEADDDGAGAAPKIIISGAPASGKGTQCEFIQEKYGVVHLSTGDMLRAAVSDGTDVGKEAKEYMDAGKLVPDDVIIGVVKDRLNEADCVESGWLLDGFPRTPAQAAALADAGVAADCFIFLNVPEEALVERVVGRRTDPETGKIYHMTFSPPEDEQILARLEQRSDDTEEKVKVRLEQFNANVAAVKSSYTDISVEVEGAKKPEEVSADIMKAIEAALA